MNWLLPLFVLSAPLALAQSRPATPLPVATPLPTTAPTAAGFSVAGLHRLDSLLTSYTADQRVPGAVALLARNGQVVYRKAFGYADLAARTPLAPEAIVRIASQTKAITVTGLMMLYEEGKFQLDDPVAKYLPAFAHPTVLATFHPQDSSYTTVPARQEVTIRQLLTHTSGIDYGAIGSPTAQAIYAKAHIPTIAERPYGTLAQSMDALGALPLLHQPGERFTYGLNMDVAGRLVEVLSGQPLDQYLRQRIFEPLGLHDTFFYLPAAQQSRLVPAYTEVKGRTVPLPAQIADYPKLAGTYFSGGGGLSSTIDDYAVFLQMLLNGGQYAGHRLLRPATVALMTQNQIGELTANLLGQPLDKFGLGFMLTTPATSAVTGLSVGSYEWGGYYGTTYWVDPREKLVVLLYTQKIPYGTTAAPLALHFKQLVYRALATRLTPAPGGKR